MADEPIKPNPPVDTAALMAEVEALRKSNREILDDYKKAKEAAKAVPPDVDVDALIAYKQKKDYENNIIICNNNNCINQCICWWNVFQIINGS